MAAGRCLKAAFPLLWSKAQTCPSLHNGEGAGSLGMSTEAETALGVIHALGPLCDWPVHGALVPLLWDSPGPGAGVSQASLWCVGS